MRIAAIVPGSGGTFYCQNCLRDNSLVKALRALGHDALMVPMYLPLFRDDAPDGGEAPVFYGAISTYLGQTLPGSGRMPRRVRRWLDAPPLLRWAAGRAGSTRARGLGDMTLSMLRGEKGRQADELERLVNWLRDDVQPDVVHLSNALLLGLAKPMRRLGCRIVCSLQDEDVWIDALEGDFPGRVWDLMRERAADVAAFTPVSAYYGGVMAERMRVPSDRMHVVHVGIDTAGYEPAATPPDPPAIGFLSRMGESLGLGILADAFLLLKQRERFRDLRLRITGGRTPDDMSFLRGLRRRLRRNGAGDDVEFVACFDRPARQEFLRSLSVLCVPVPAGEAFGGFLLEAMACGVPAVQPPVGAFPEVIAATGGGLIADACSPAALSATLAELLADPTRARALGARGREVVLRDFTIERMGAEMARVYALV